MKSSMKSSIVRVMLAALVAALSLMFDARRSGDADADAGLRFGISTVSAWGEEDCPAEQQQCDEEVGVTGGGGGGGGGGYGGGGGLHVTCRKCVRISESTVSCREALTGEIGGCDCRVFPRWSPLQRQSA